MFRIGHFSLVLASAVGLFCCLPMQSQSADADVSVPRGKVKIVPQAVPPGPFSTESDSKETARSIEFRTADQMSQQDRLLAADAESSIAEHAGRSGFDFEGGKWDYEQIVCPALPNHLFLRYKRNTGTGDETVFSASIPRGGEGRVRIVPILRRGYSLFSPAPINALTISAFNHIRAEEAEERNANWLGNGLCYAALAGGHPVVSSADDAPSVHHSVPDMTAMLVVEEKGGEVIRFADSAAHPRPMVWTMSFTRKGKLIKATHVPAHLMEMKTVPEKSAVTKTRTIPADAKD